MIIGERLRQLREEKKMSQGDIEHKTGLLRCYLSRCENGHTVPSIATLEKWANALELPLYRLFYDGAVPKSLKPIGEKQTPAISDTPAIKKLRGFLARMTDRDRAILLKTAVGMARKNQKEKEK
jgi:transcriptional regulator with XRE-family HTH domain